MVPTASPESRVLLTVELAEQILSYLPFQDLVHAELVCRMWRDIIQWSSHTRQGLFLEPTSHHLSIAYRSESKLRKPWQYRSLNIMRYIETYTIALLHPYLVPLPKMERRGLTAFTLDVDKGLSLRPDGRWRDMFISQPPCRNARIDYEMEPDDPSNAGIIMARIGKDRVTNMSGVRLGLLVDKLRDILAKDDIGNDGPSPRFHRLVCYIDGFISEQAAFLLASQAATRKPRPVNLE